MIDTSVNFTHGGDLDNASRVYGIPREQWLDLSTGIAPWGWPVETLPSDVWQRLPAIECPLRDAAGHYYSCDPETLLAIPGSQFAIMAIPALLPSGRVALPELGYFEHRKAWSEAGHEIVDYCSDTDADMEALEARIQAGQVDSVVVINPNNPTTALIDKARLLKWWQWLSRRGGHLIVDEAFMDSADSESLSPECPRPGLVVLRSVGKFFGLAGLRLGFALAAPELMVLLQSRLGPWAVNGPAQYVGALALRDKAWQDRQRQRIASSREKLLTLLNHVFSEYAGPEGCELKLGPLFLSVFLPDALARDVAGQLAQRGIWLRRFAVAKQPHQKGCLRFGLCKDAEQHQRLAQALNHLELKV